MIGIKAERFVQPGTQVATRLPARRGNACRYVVTFIIMKIAVNSLPFSQLPGDGRTLVAIYIDAYKAPVPVDVVEGDIREIEIHNASMVILNFTPAVPLPRLKTVSCCWTKFLPWLNLGGALVLSEKFSFEDADVGELVVQYAPRF